MTTKELLLNEIEHLNPIELTELYTVAQQIKSPSKKLPHRSIIHHPNILSGEPIIAGTRTPIRAIVENWRLGIPPEEIPTHLPHLTLAQVFDALSYYSENQEEINGYIERNRIPDELLHPLVRDL